MFFLVKIQLVLTVFGAYIVPNLANNNDEEVRVSLFRDGRFFPGQIIDTYWCGSGNVSRGPKELGPNYEVDWCCYDHDHCPVYIEPGEKKYERTNIGKYTQVSCHCDVAFDRCLRTVNSWSAWAVIAAYGATYPECLDLKPELSCQSPGGDYKLNPCAGYRCSSNLPSSCEVVGEKWVTADSKFKIHELKKDREEASKENKERNRMMFHRSTPPIVLYTSPIPSAVHIFNSAP